MICAVTSAFWSAPRSAVSVVVPGMTPTFFPPKSWKLVSVAVVLTRRLPPSTKVMLLKSTCSCRESVLVVEPHSRSMVPPTTAEIRVSTVTGTHFTSSFWRRSCCCTPVTTLLQRSTE